MNKFFIILTLFFVLPYSLIAQDGNLENKMGELGQSIKDLQQRQDSLQNELQDLKLQAIQRDLRTMGLPALQAGDEVVEHAAMSLVYAEPYEQAKWVAHIILPDIINGVEGRSNDFRPDNLIKTGSAVEADYFLKAMQPDSTYEYDGFGYDRGHLAPSADFRWSAKALSESFLYSNMSPQVAELNRGRWAELEGLLRNYVYNNPSTQLYVVTGPILKEGLPKIERGTNHVSIPEKFFKAVLDLKNGRAIGFIMPNKEIIYPVESFAVSIDKIEAETGLDLFPKLPDAVEGALEAQSDTGPWLDVYSEGKIADVPPLHPTTLPPKHFNTTQARLFMDKGKEITVCGTVVSTKLTKKGFIFINLDKQFPNQVFSIMISKDDALNFSYRPDKVLMGKKICVKGVVRRSSADIPQMNLTTEESVSFMDEEWE
jgi:endonuclease G